MRSSSTRPELYRLIWHPALSVSVAMTSMLALMTLLARLAGLPGPRTVTVIFVIVAPVVEATVGNLLYAERAGFANRIRELIIYLMVVYAVISLGRPGPIGARFVPSSTHVLPLLAPGIAWLNAFRIHNKLRGREGLLRTFSGKYGEELRHALVERQHDMALTVRELRFARASILSWLFLLSVVAIFTATGPLTGSDLPAGSAAFILLCASAFTTAAAVATLNGFIDEYAANGVGLTVPFRFQRRRVVAATGLISIAFVAGFVLSRNESLLPLDAIGALLQWIGNLFARRERAELPPLPSIPALSVPYSYYLQRILPGGEPAVPPLWLRLLALLLRRLAVALAAGTITVLLFAPLFSPAFREAVRTIKPRKITRDLLARMRRRMRFLARWLRFQLRLFFTGSGGEGNGGKQARADAAGGQNGYRWRPGVRKRRQMDRVVSLFARVVEWGSARGLDYRSSEGAGEFLDRVVSIFPERGTAARTCGQLFWRARYSRETLRRAEMREYLQSVRSITAAG